MKDTKIEKLKDGDDSGAVSDRVKRQLLSDGLGICAAPNCLNRIDVLKTRLGECAHIIPRKVGSHPREDYIIPLEDRKKEDNLLYLCEKHHKIVDNELHAKIYTADLLREWKRNHEQWATSVTKDSPYISKDLKIGLDRLFKGFQQDFTKQSNSSISILKKLLEACRELLNRQLLEEASALLSQMELFLIDSDNHELKCQADTLSAILLIHSEQITEAKESLLHIIKEFPHDIDPMLEYIELCEGFPEPGDESAHIEIIAQELENDHPRLRLIDLKRIFDKGEVPEHEEIPDKISDDVRLNCRLLCQKSLFCDRLGEYSRRDSLVNEWEDNLPNSARPNFFRILYKVGDTFRSRPDKVQLKDAIELFMVEKEKLAKKDPLIIRDQISLRMHELRLMLADTQVSGEVHDLDAICNDITNLITQCYLDTFIDITLADFLPNILLEPEQWLALVVNIKESKVELSIETRELLFSQALQYEELTNDLAAFSKGFGEGNLNDLLDSIKKKNAEKTAKLLNTRNRSIFTLTVIRSLQDCDFQLKLLDLVQMDVEHKDDILYARIDALAKIGKEKDAVALISSLPMGNAAPPALSRISRIAFENQRWSLFIPPALKLLELDVPPNFRAQLNAQLAVAYRKQGDDSNAVKYAELALAEYENLGDHNAQIVLHVIGQALSLKGQVNEACDIHEKYRSIKRTFPLLLEEAELLLKSSMEDKYDRALSVIKEAFRNEETYNDNLFLYAFTSLIELGNAKAIELKNEESIEDGLFVKLDGFKNGWFYIGPDEKSMGATSIVQGTPNYKALIHKNFSESIVWPADRFSGNNIDHKIIHILKLPTYLSQRAHEAMENEARVGNAPIWSIRVIKDDGSLDIENINNFYKDQFKDIHAFFETYVTSPIPFSFLCRKEGSLTQAIGKVTSEQRGFIRCNNGSQADLDEQKATTEESLGGRLCSIDGLSALMLAESGLLDLVTKKLPSLLVSTSVIRTLRETARNFESSASSRGNASFVKGNIRYHEVDEEVATKLRVKLLSAADLLDSLAGKVVSNDYSNSGDKDSLDYILPEYFVDPFRQAQRKDANFLTDDALLVQAYSVSGETTVPKKFSSLSLVRGLFDAQVISWHQYVDYFSLLSSYRYYLLPISVNDLMKSVFPTSNAELVTFEPKNLLKLNLRLVLSKEYGVDESILVRILSGFFSVIILDESITPQIAEEIFQTTIFETLENRCQRLAARAILQICDKNMPNDNWISKLASAKLGVLEKQLSQYIQQYSPLIIT